MKGETYKALKKFEGAMQVAKTCGYIRLTSTQVMELAQLYNEAFGKELTRSQKTCGHCLQRVAVALYDEYLKYKNSPRGRKIDKEENANQEQTESE